MKTNKTFNNTMTWTNVQSRNSAFPLERYSIFAQLSDAAEYALSNVLAYEGQVIAVTNNSKQEVYVLDSTLSNTELSGLRKVGTDIDLSSYLSNVTINGNTLTTNNSSIDLGNFLSSNAITTGTTNGAINVNGTDVSVKGLGTAAYTASSDYILNSTAQTLSTLLSNDLSTKIWIENRVDQSKSPGFSDLSIIKLSDAEYEQLLIDAHFNVVDIDEKTLYVISADNVNAYGQRIENLTMTDDTTPSQAATKHYVDSILSAFDNSKYAANQTLSGGLNLNSDLSVVLSALVEVWKMFGGKTT